MKYIELYNSVKREVENMEFKRFLILVFAAVFVVMYVQLPELIDVLK